MVSNLNISTFITKHLLLFLSTVLDNKEYTNREMGSNKPLWLLEQPITKTNTKDNTKKWVNNTIFHTHAKKNVEPIHIQLTDNYYKYMNNEWKSSPLNVVTKNLGLNFHSTTSNTERTYFKNETISIPSTDLDQLNKKSEVYLIIRTQ